VEYVAETLQVGIR